MTIYDLTDEYRRLEELDVNSPEDAETLEALTAELVNNFDAKAESYCKVLRNKAARADALREEARKLTEKARVEEAAIDRIKDRLQWAAEQVWEEGITHQCGVFTMRIQRTPPRVELTGEVPVAYTKTKTEPDKALIMEALKNGEVLTFAELTRGLTLAIR